MPGMRSGHLRHVSPVEEGRTSGRSCSTPYLARRIPSWDEDSTRDLKFRLKPNIQLLTTLFDSCPGMCLPPAKRDNGSSKMPCWLQRYIDLAANMGSRSSKTKRRFQQIVTPIATLSWRPRRSPPSHHRGSW
ncbi:uncharacterized protein LOC125537367 [Triticum urartu]|uniref:uncharacterized protein LOC125537367 n=1 Tax=Triticum urartu TaxID=4572 RepID=UPI0020443567|nr:uncharacterized protein LOC125537367 [Triticum urartu]XP_048556629.1 uncharacterized protein LOC125537367 [Triticum urartu]XP_048556630.1 uncharacterized protein LOC125537367 [Triticum urartu]